MTGNLPIIKQFISNRWLHKLLSLASPARPTGLASLSHLILDHVLHEFRLGDAPRPARAGDGIAKVDNAGEVGVVGIQVADVRFVARSVDADVGIGEGEWFAGNGNRK